MYAPFVQVRDDWVIIFLWNFWSIINVNVNVQMQTINVFERSNTERIVFERSDTTCMWTFRFTWHLYLNVEIQSNPHELNVQIQRNISERSDSCKWIYTRTFRYAMYLNVQQWTCLTVYVVEPVETPIFREL